MTGVAAPQFTSFLMNGTNWIGFPSQGNQVVEDAIGVNDLTDVTQVKNKDISRLSDGSNWTSGQLLELQPTNGYKLFLSNLKAVTIPGILLNPLHDPAVPVLRSLDMLADPNDASSWSIDLGDFAFTDVIPVVGRMVDSGVTILADGQKKVAAFINGELRGVGNLENFAMLSDDLFTLFIGKDDVDNNAMVQMYYYDGSTVSDSMMLNVSDLTVQGHGVYKYNDPLIWEIYCPQNLILTIADSPLDGVYEASQVITINGDVQVLNGANVILNAPDVILNQVNTDQGAVLEIQQTGCN